MKILTLDLYEKPGSKKTRRIMQELNEYAEVDIVSFHSNDFSCERMNGYDGIIITGSNSYETYGKKTKSSGIKESILDLTDDGVNILAICGGTQLIGIVYNYTRLKLEQPESGWKKIYLTPEGKKDPLFRGLKKEFEVYESHHLALKCDEPNKTLAKNDICTQSFLFHPYARGIQFHPEEGPKNEEYPGRVILKNFVEIIKR